MSDPNTVRGYRIYGDKKPDRELSMGYLHLTEVQSHTLTALRKAVRDKGANCDGKPGKVSDTLPSDRDAEIACAGCPSFQECQIYLMVAKPAHGVYAGVVKGRNLDLLEEE